MTLFELIAFIGLLIYSSFTTYIGYKMTKDTDERYK